jgi:SAM-dependent methyltransferase
MKIALKITPQRSTQYAHMTAELAIPEVQASPLGVLLQTLQPLTLAGQAYLLLETAESEQAEALRALLPTLIARMGAVSEAYEYFEQIGETVGPLLRPIEPTFRPFVPLEMAEARRYKGKTNETFTRVLLNSALFAGAYRSQLNERLRILDPLCGGGTTLFLALAAGYDAFGIDIDRQDIETTAVFVQQYLQSERIHYKEVDEKGRRAGRRYQFEIGPKGNMHHLVLVNGDTREAPLHLREVVGGAHVHAIVGDLPYGIQHFGEIAGLLNKALPAWEQLLLPGGALALAWNATRVERAALLELFVRNSSLRVLDDPPFNQFLHPVDRVIKRRDIIVAVKE